MSLPPIEIKPLSQLITGQDWNLSLAHDRPEYVVIWITRGQGRMLLNGTRRGVGAHNAIAIPPRTLFSLELGRQSGGMMALIPDGTDIRLPTGPRQLRVRDVDPITELTGIFEAAHRETTQGRSLAQDAIDAHMALMSVWLRRQIALPDHLPVAVNAAARLSARFCERVARHHTEGLNMADHAAALNVTATHLTRACKAATGRTAADLLTERFCTRPVPRLLKRTSRHRTLRGIWVLGLPPISRGSCSNIPDKHRRHCAKRPGSACLYQMRLAERMSQTDLVCVANKSFFLKAAR